MSSEIDRPAAERPSERWAGRHASWPRSLALAFMILSVLPLTAALRLVACPIVLFSRPLQCGTLTDLETGGVWLILAIAVLLLTLAALHLVIGFRLLKLTAAARRHAMRLAWFGMALAAIWLIAPLRLEGPGLGWVMLSLSVAAYASVAVLLSRSEGYFPR